MTDSFDGAAPTRDQDAVETDAHATSSAEDLDEDRLRLDPLEAGMDPPERWSGADRYGMTPYEQAHPRGLSERLSEEEPDVQDAPGGPAQPEPERAATASGVLDEDAGLDAEVMRESAGRGQLADEAGGSVAAVTRMPDEPPGDDVVADDPELPPR